MKRSKKDRIAGVAFLVLSLISISLKARAEEPVLMAFPSEFSIKQNSYGWAAFDLMAGNEKIASLDQPNYTWNYYFELKDKEGNVHTRISSGWDSNNHAPFISLSEINGETKGTLLLDQTHGALSTYSILDETHDLIGSLEVVEKKDGVFVEMKGLKGTTVATMEKVFPLRASDFAGWTVALGNVSLDPRFLVAYGVIRESRDRAWSNTKFAAKTAVAGVFAGLVVKDSFFPAGEAVICDDSCSESEKAADQLIVEASEWVRSQFFVLNGFEVCKPEIPDQKRVGAYFRKIRKLMALLHPDKNPGELALALYQKLSGLLVDLKDLKSFVCGTCLKNLRRLATD